MFYSFAIDTQANLEESDFSEPHEGKHHSLPTTTHSSPASISPPDRSLDSPHSSFQAKAHPTHAANVWTASIDYLRRSDFGEVYEERGVNVLGASERQGGLEDAIKTCSLLRSRERSKFLGELQREGELCGLLAELMLLFSAPIFQEMLFLVHNLWQRQYLPYRLRRSSGLLNQFKAFVGWEGEQKEVQGVESLSWDAAQVRQSAQEGLQELARELFYSKRLKLLSFSSGANVGKRERRVIEGEFLLFLRSLSKAVFLSAQGFYEVEECEGWRSWAECGELDGRFVRAFSQIQADNEGLQLASKRRKLE